MIADRLAFLEHRRKVNIPLVDGSDRVFSIALNISVGLYFEIAAKIDEFKSVHDELQRMEIIYELVAGILKVADKSITVEWVIKHISIDNQVDLIIQIMNEVNNLVSNNCFSIPDIKPRKLIGNNNKVARDRAKTKDEIEKYNRLLAGKIDISLMDDIAIVMSKTNNSFSEIMKMPILIFKDIVRTIILNEYRSDDEYNLAYLKYKAKELNMSLNSGKAVVEPEAPINKGANLKGLKALLS